MATCKSCGKKGLFLKVNQQGRCEQCQSAADLEYKLSAVRASLDAQIEERKEQLQQLDTALQNRETAYHEIRIKAEEDAQRKMEMVLRDKQAEVASLAGKTDALQAYLANLQEQILETDDAILLQSFGMYTPHYSFTTSEEYKAKLAEIRGQQKQLIRDKLAVTGDINWTVNNSEAKGRKMVGDMQKLLLRAFNAECDDAIEHVKFNNIVVCEKKIQRSADAVSKLGAVMGIAITSRYLQLKDQELHLMHEYQLKKQQEKEEAKEARARMREEAQLAKELEEARRSLKKEQAHYQNALKKLQSQLAQAEGEELAALEEKKVQVEGHLAQIEKEFHDVDYREKNQRAGYVYIISNIGAFGENVYKIGMTRRLDPTERVDELGDASVPFNFDIHAMIFSEDAPKLEAALHQAFADRKLNFVNQRREFFHVTLDEIKQVVRENYDKTVEFVDTPEAEQFRQSARIRELAQERSTS